MGKRKQSKSKAVVFSDPTWSVSDPAFAEWLRTSGIDIELMTEERAAGLTAFYRGEALVAGTIASLPLKVYRRTDAGRDEIQGHWLTYRPAGPFDLPAFNWVETIVLHLMNHSEAYLKHITNGGGEVIGLWPVHPLAINRVDWVGPDKRFEVALTGGESVEYRTGEMTQILGMSVDGKRGMSQLRLFRQSLSTSLTADRAANKAFTSGASIGGIVTTDADEDVDETEAKTISEKLNGKIAGPDNAGQIAFINRHLKFSPWAMTLEDAQFIESRTFQIEEVARITGVPPHLLMSTTKVTSWGSGIAEQNLGLAKFTLMLMTSRLESALAAVLNDDEFCEFEYKGLLAGTPKDEVELLIKQVEAGLLTDDEARAIQNRPPLTDEQRAKTALALAARNGVLQQESAPQQQGEPTNG